MKLIVLKSKHWVIFLLTVGLIFLHQFIIAPVLLFEKAEILFITNEYIIFTLPLLIYFIWLWNIGSILPQNTSYLEVKKQAILFKISMLIPIIHNIILFFILLIFYSEYLQGDEIPFFFITDYLDFIIPFEIISILSFLYSNWLISIIINKIEQQKQLPLMSYFKDFILLLLFPIGIWYLQPRINKLVYNYQKEQ